jgi:ribosomal protein L2, bacterial/organellar|tara:strand:- start:1589 stop:2419 length:831 start_codon:yes stop_codon:yes gene_type:complete
MALKTYKSYTKSTRGTVLVDRKGLWKGKPIKSLTFGKTSTGGRNNLGRITSRHKGAGHKNKHRVVDFYRKKDDMKAKVERIEYDPNRSSYLALIKYEDGVMNYILAPNKIKKGDEVISGRNKAIKIGNCMPLSDIAAGTNIHNIELSPNGGGKIARSAGSSAQISGSDENYCIIKLASGEIRKIINTARATIGTVSNSDHQNIMIGKAGRNRWKGIRPQSRGVAMNPVDHPHGGGEGKTSGGRSPVSPWGQSAKGLKTRKNKQTNKFIISRRKKRN